MYRSGLLRLLVAAEDRRLALDAHEDREDRRRDDDVAHGDVRAGGEVASRGARRRRPFFTRGLALGGGRVLSMRARRAVAPPRALMKDHACVFFSQCSAFFAPRYRELWCRAFDMCVKRAWQTVLTR